jgi:hypothetical protein
MEIVHQLTLTHRSSSLWCMSFHLNTDDMQLIILVSLWSQSARMVVNLNGDRSQDLQRIPALECLSHFPNVTRQRPLPSRHIVRTEQHQVELRALVKRIEDTMLIRPNPYTHALMLAQFHHPRVIELVEFFQGKGRAVSQIARLRRLRKLIKHKRPCN